MAAKKKKTVAKYTGKVGHIVQVTWIDSGCRYTRAGIPPEDCDLSTINEFGRIIHMNKRRMVLTSHEHKNQGRSPHNEVYEIIWRPSIQKIRRLR